MVNVGNTHADTQSSGRLRIMQFAEAPALPRAPTEIRLPDVKEDDTIAPSAVPFPSAGRAPPSPPRFPSLRDVRVGARAVPEKKSSKLRKRISKFPDPTILFLLETMLLIAIHVMRPALLRTWLARAIVPAILVPTVAASALWRKTIPKLTVHDLQSAAPPGVLPNAKRLVKKGIALRRREALLRQAEEELRRGQLRLEVLRKEIDSRLPSHISMAHLMDADKESEARRDAERNAPTFQARPSSNTFASLPSAQVDANGNAVVYN